MRRPGVVVATACPAIAPWRRRVPSGAGGTPATTIVVAAPRQMKAMPGIASPRIGSRRQVMGKRTTWERAVFPVLTTSDANTRMR